MRPLRLPGVALAGVALVLGLVTACDGDSAEPTAAPAPTAGAVQNQRSPDGGEPTGRERPLTGKVVVVDPGHNGANGANPAKIRRKVDIGNGTKECDTTGTATNAGYSESAFNWDVSARLVKILEARGAKVVLTRENDRGVGPCITERAAIGNRAKADAAISVHADGSGAKSHGFHVIEPAAVKGGRNTASVPASQRLGREIRDAYHAGTGMPYANYIGKNGLDRRTDLGGLNMSTVPKVFVECGNMRNAEEAAKLSNAEFRQRIADALAQGLTSYLT